MQFASRPCALGLNAICESCERCSFPDAKSEKHCETFPEYMRWSQANCCIGTRGEKVSSLFGLIFVCLFLISIFLLDFVY
jgi:hypothetical protein